MILSAIKKRGIMLITTLLTVVLVVMIITAVVHSGVGGLSMSGNFHDREAAMMAADSGMQYAMTRLQNNINWKGDSDSTYLPASDALTVREDEGNVVGLMQTKTGDKVAFRIKFSREDGSDGFKADTKYPIESEYVSLNNLYGTSKVHVYRADSNGKGKTSTSCYDLPRASACIIVEGMAGPALREATFENYTNWANKGWSLSTVRRTVETFVSVDASLGLDASAYAAGGIKARLAKGGTFAMNSNDSKTTPRIRSLGSIDIASFDKGKVKFDSNDGELIVKDGQSVSLNGKDAKTKVSYADSTDYFKLMTWNSVTKATQNSDYNLDAGTYVWTTRNGSKQLVYFDQSYPIGTEVPTTGGTVVSFNDLNSAITASNDDMALLISDNVYVNPTNGCNDLIIRTDDTITSGRPIIGFASPEEGDRSSVLTSTGNVQFQGGILGTGSVTAEGSVTCQGPSVFESDPETGVSIYAQGDINLNAIETYSKKNKSSSVDLNKLSGKRLAYAGRALHQVGNYDDGFVQAKHGQRGGGGSYGDEIAQKYQNYWSNYDDCDIFLLGSGMDARTVVEGYAAQYAEEAGYELADCPYEVLSCGQFKIVIFGVKYGDSLDDPNPDPTPTATSTPTQEGEQTSEDVIAEINSETEDCATEASNAEVTDPEQAVQYTSEVVSGLYVDSNNEARYNEYLTRKKEQLKDLIDKYGSVNYADQDITGVIYTWGNFNVNVGTKSHLNITGTVIAYGADPTSQDKTAGSLSGKGAINVRASSVDLTYDPSYLQELMNSGCNLRLKRTLWATW